jgi:RNA polymerase sigma-70 factor (ECF subfamily)
MFDSFVFLSCHKFENSTMVENVIFDNAGSGLLRRISEGDEAAFSCFFEQYSDKIFYFLYKTTHSQSISRDLLQDIFLHLWLNRGKIVEIHNIDAYLFRMARNHALNELERFVRKNLELTDSHDREYQGLDPLDQMTSDELKEKLDEAIRKLPPKQQQVFILHKEEGKSYDQIASQLNLSPSTIHNHMHHALANLRRQLKRIYPDLFAAILLIVKFF